MFRLVVFSSPRSPPGAGWAATIRSLARAARRQLALEHGLIRPRAWAHSKNSAWAPLRISQFLLHFRAGNQVLKSWRPRVISLPHG